MENKKEDIKGLISIDKKDTNLPNKRILIVEKRIKTPSMVVKNVDDKKEEKKTPTNTKSKTKNAKTVTKTTAKKAKKETKKEVVKSVNKTKKTTSKTTKKAAQKPAKKVTTTKKAAIEEVSIKVDPIKEDISEQNNNKIIRNICYVILGIILICSLSYIGYKLSQSVSNQNLYTSLYHNYEDNKFVVGGNSLLKELRQENPDIKGFIKIENTNINYPLLQGLDNEYYLTHNYKNEKTSYGSIFINTNSNLNNNNSNVIIYGHDMKDNQMFSELLNYANKDYYENHKVITIETEEGESKYEIVCAFKSKVFYKDDKNVFRFYNYYNLDSEDKYNEYISNCKKIQLYDTGTEANFGNQLLTLITCEYSQENGRMVVVAVKK